MRRASALASRRAGRAGALRGGPGQRCAAVRGEQGQLGARDALAEGIASRDGVRHGSDEASFLRRAPDEPARTLAECAALQCVPLEVLAGFSERVAHELCGNAVPAPLAEHVARVLLRADGQDRP